MHIERSEVRHMIGEENGLALLHEIIMTHHPWFND